jgi:antitoxin component YwqK of YwqJK toxin-antitoxin module
MGVVKFRRDAIWTGVLIAVAYSLLVSPLGAEPPDLDDKVVRERIIAEAIPMSQLEKRGEPDEELRYLPNKQTLYSGWAKDLYDSGQVQQVAQIKDGKRQGPYTEWYENGQKSWECTYKDDNLEGLSVEWYESGQKSSEFTYKGGKENGSCISWHEDGEVNGMPTFKDGVIVD